MGGLSPILYRLLVPACHAKKWSKSTRQPKVRLPPGIPLISVKTQQSLTLLISVLSLNRKNVDNHYCCPISDITLTTSKLEAILKIYHCSLKLSKRGRGVRGGARCEGKQLNNVLFPTAPMLHVCTVLPLISLSPISVLLWRPLSI
jgi:hypothetical protein